VKHNGSKTEGLQVLTKAKEYNTIIMHYFVVHRQLNSQEIRNTRAIQNLQPTN